MGILLGEEDNTPDWDKEIARLTGNAEAEENEDVAEETEEPVSFESEKAEKPFLTLQYDITPEEYLEAYDIVYKMDVMTKLLLPSLFTGAVGIALATLSIMGKINIMFIALGAVLLGMAVSIYLMPRKARKMFYESVKALKDDRYKMSVYNMHLIAETVIPDEDKKLAEELFEGDKAQAESDGGFDKEKLQKIEKTGLSVQPEPTRVEYPKEDMAVRENDRFFLLFIDNTTWFTIPKRCLADEQISVFRDRVAVKMPEYINLDD